jgi:pimeloyl-ACP methyl ester carboxylesterase
MATFILVHGAWHGAWCWDLLIPELERRGHRAIASDRPIDEPTASGMMHAETVLRDVPDVTDELLVVGHSEGGLIAPLIATLRPVRRIVYLAGLIPTLRMSASAYFASASPRVSTPGYQRHYGSRQIARPDGSSSWPEDAAIEAFYHDCPPDQARWAASRLRLHTWTVSNEVCPLDSMPATETASILCREDRVINPEWSRHVARERLGVDALEMPGGHSPFLSRPSELADLLVQGL